MKTCPHSILLFLAAALSAHNLQAQANPPGSPPPPNHRVTEETSIELNRSPDAPSPFKPHSPRHVTSEVRTLSANSPTTHTTKMAGVIGALNRPGIDHSGQVLQIRTRDFVPDTVDQLDEDLNVMSRILQKATQIDSAGGPRAMGIDLMTASTGGPVRSLYLEDYGVLFMINANIQLLPLPTEGQETTEQPRPDKTSTWEAARRELYGSPVPPEPGFPMGWIGETQGPLAYDASQVEQLRRNLIDTLKNASNIRHLQPDAWITVCLQGAAANPLVHARREVVYGADQNVRRIDELLLQQLGALDPSPKLRKTVRTVMTFQARKTDIDQFSRNELSADQFAEKVLTHSYLATGSWDRAFIWNSR